MTPKDKINKMTTISSLPGAPIVYVRHCEEDVSIVNRSPWGGTNFQIHPDVTLKEFYA